MSEPAQTKITLVGLVDQQLSAKVIESKLMFLIKLIQQIDPEFEIKFEEPAIAPRPEIPGIMAASGA